MASELRVDKIIPSSGTNVAIGTDGGTVSLVGNNNIITSGNATIGGNLGVGGVLTYEDVTNIDSVGVITARGGIRIGATGANSLITGNADGIGIKTAAPSSLALEIVSPFNDVARMVGPNSGNITFRNATANEVILHTGNSDALIFGTNGGTERMRISSEGYVTHQDGKKCAFNVKGTNMSRTDASGYVCDFDNDTSSGCFDSGNNFNTSTNEFTAPVSGYYYFFTNIRLDSFNSGYIRTAILSTSYHAGTVYYAIPSTGHVITYADNGSIQTVQTSTVMYLPATHKAWVYQDPSSDTSYTCYLNESSFGGYFIG